MSSRCAAANHSVAELRPGTKQVPCHGSSLTVTQLTLGVDRDSELLADIFDEEDPGVKLLITQVVKAAHARGKKVGLCGQAPSDRPEFAGFLASIGIDSISVTPDALPTVVAHLVKFAGR